MAQPSEPSSSVKDITSQSKESIDNATEQVQDAAAQLQRQVKAIGGNLIDVVDKSLKDRPVATLAMAGILGIFIGAIWKR